jgi:hypothetical protein
MPTPAPDLLAAIGNTPLVRLRQVALRVAESLGLDATVATIAMDSGTATSRRSDSRRPEAAPRLVRLALPVERCGRRR